jgi:hypothetical protein
MRNTFLLILLFFSINIYFNTTCKEDTKLGIRFSGFVRYDVMFDTRQTIASREGYYLLYPARPVYDINNRNINASPSLNMFTINSWLKLALTGPDVLHAASTAYFEVDFWGSEVNKLVDLNHFRLRHAWAKFSWDKTELLIGQFWHPMSVTGFFPRPASSNSGVPFHPISRNPQIRIMHKVGIMKLISSVLSQRDFPGTGPEGPGSQYLRNSAIPNIHFQVQCGGDSSNIVAGAGIDYKKIVPEIHTVNDDGEITKTGNSLSGFSYTGFLKVNTEHISARAQGVYAQNAYDILLIGGYGVKEITNIQTGEKEFSNLNTISVWGDVQTTGDKIRLGIFCGYTKNMGAGNAMSGPFYARGVDIASVYRISPRVVYMREPVSLSLEGEYTTANYGKANGDMKGGVTDTNSVANVRTVLSFKYYF